MPWKQRTPTRTLLERRRQIRQEKVRTLMLGLGAGVLAALLVGGLLYYFGHAPRI